jgi:hypothetical protein
MAAPYSPKAGKRGRLSETGDLFFPPSPETQELLRRRKDAQRAQNRQPAARIDTISLRDQVRIYLEHRDLAEVLEWARTRAPQRIKVLAFQADSRRRQLASKLKG